LVRGHTKPRREKKLVEDCERRGISAKLPCYERINIAADRGIPRSRPFRVMSFFSLPTDREIWCVRDQHVANLLDVFDRAIFHRQLQDIFLALEANLEVWLAPSIGEECGARIKAGPLQGLEGWVEKRYGMETVLLRLDFINQAAAVNWERNFWNPV